MRFEAVRQKERGISDIAWSSAGIAVWNSSQCAVLVVWAIIGLRGCWMRWEEWVVGGDFMPQQVSIFPCRYVCRERH